MRASGWREKMEKGSLYGEDSNMQVGGTSGGKVTTYKSASGLPEGPSCVCCAKL